VQEVTELPPSAIQYFAKQRIDVAEKRLFALEDNAHKESREDRESFEKFYNTLALFAGGTIALSINYLGYLKTLNKPVHDHRLLVASWIALFICLLFSLLFVFFHLHYSHHFREWELCEAFGKKNQAYAEEMPRMGLQNLSTPQEISDFQTPLQAAATASFKDAVKHERLYKRYRKLWRFSARIAQLGFVGGIGMLLWFAVSNI
jgi:hypothetical protein